MKSALSDSTSAMVCAPAESWTEKSCALCSRTSPASRNLFDLRMKRRKNNPSRLAALRPRWPPRCPCAPCSKFRVGAAMLTVPGKTFVGCNVENASYGMTNCAERTAIFAAVAQLGPKVEIRAVAVTNDRGVPCAPCGACRQVIYEFGPDATVFFRGKNGAKQAHITELLPEGFRLP